MKVPVPKVQSFSSDRSPLHNNTIVTHQNDPFDFPPGFRFCPFDHELILYYLKRKVMNKTLPHNKIQEVNLYKYNPEDLSAMYSMLGEKVWYFFTPRDRKYRNGNRPNRAAGDGYWKATGADRLITHEGEIIGYRKALVYYKGRPPKGEKTNWIMHEYRVKEATTPKPRGGADPMRLDEWVLCRIYKKKDKLVKCTQKDENDEARQVSQHREPAATSPHPTSVTEEQRFQFPPNEMMPFHPCNDAFEFGNDPAYNDAHFINCDYFIPQIFYTQPLDFCMDNILSPSVDQI